MTTYTRLTVIGTDRRAELVVPDGEPVAALLPDLLVLLEQAPGPVSLVTRTGDQLDAMLSLADQGIADGTPLWVTALDAAPAPAQVADITDLTADTHDTRPDAWSPRWWPVVAAPAMAVLSWFATREVGRMAAVCVLVALVALACVLGRTRRTSLATLLAAAGAGAAVQVALNLPGDGPAWLAALTSLGLICAVTALVGAAGFGHRALGLGGGVGATLVLVLGVAAANTPLVDAAATVAVLGVAVLSVAPGLAMAASGLSGLDDRLVAGGDADRALARSTVDAAYRSLTWLVAATVAVASVCGAVAAWSTPWGRWLAAAVAVVLTLRMRVFPLIPQRVVLVLGALGTAAALLAGLPPVPAAASAAALAVLIAAATAIRLSPVVVARLNRWADLLETVAVTALVPLLAAQWGVFEDLAGAFG